MLFPWNNWTNHDHDDTYQFSIMVIKRNTVLDGDNAISSNSINRTTKNQVKQFEDRIEYIEQNGTTTIF